MRKALVTFAFIGVAMSASARAQDVSVDKLHDSLTKVGALSSQLIKESRSDEDAIAVAVALTQAAETIYRELGGPRLAAAQFQAVADRLTREQH